MIPVSLLGLRFTVLSEVVDAELDGTIEDVLELWLFGDLVDEGGVGGGILGLVFFDEVEVACVSDHQAVLFNFVKLALLCLHQISYYYLLMPILSLILK